MPTNCVELSTRFNNYVGEIDLKVGSGTIGLKQVYLIQPEETRFDHYVAKTAVVCETTLQAHSAGPETCVLTFRSLLRVRSMFNIPIQAIIRRDGHSSSLMCYDKSYEIEPHALWDVPIPFLEMEDCFLIVLIRDGHHIEERGPFPMGNIFGVDDELRKDVKLRNLQKQLVEKGIRLTKTEIGSSLVCKTTDAQGSSDLRRTKGAAVEDEKGFVKNPEPLHRLFEYVLDILPLFTLSNALPIPVTFEILQVGDNDVTEVEEEHARKAFGASHNGRNRPTIASRQSKSVLPGDECHIVGLNLDVSCSIVFVLETLPGEQNLVSEPTVFPLERHKNWVKDFDKDDKTVTFNYWDPLYDYNGQKKFHHDKDQDGNSLSSAHFSNPTPILMGSIQCRRQLVECGCKVSIFSPVWVIDKSGLPLLYKYHTPLLKKALKTNKISQHRRESRQQRFYRHHSACFRSPKHDEPKGTDLSVAEKEERVLRTAVLHASFSSEDILPVKSFTPIASMKSSLSSASPFGSRRRGDSVPRSSEKDVLFSHEMWAKRFGANAPILLPSQDGKLQVGVYTPDASCTGRRFTTGDTPSCFATSGDKPSHGASDPSGQFRHSFADKDDLQTQLDSFQYFSKVSASNRQPRDVANENQISWSKECSLDDDNVMNEYKDCFCDDAFVASSSLSSLPGCAFTIPVNVSLSK